MSIRRKSQRGRQRLEKEVERLSIHQAIYECASDIDARFRKFDISRMNSLETRLAALEAEVRELRRTLPMHPK